MANLDPVVISNGRVHSAAFYQTYGEQQTKETGANINQYFTKIKKKKKIPSNIQPAENSAIRVNTIQQVNTKSHIPNIYRLQREVTLNDNTPGSRISKQIRTSQHNSNNFMNNRNSIHIYIYDNQKYK